MTIAANAQAAHDALTYPARGNFADEDSHTAAWKEYHFVLVPAIEKEFCQALAAEHLPAVPTEVSDKVFSLAWDQGSSSGYSEVENYYLDFAELATLAYSAK